MFSIKIVTLVLFSTIKTSHSEPSQWTHSECTIINGVVVSGNGCRKQCEYDADCPESRPSCSYGNCENPCDRCGAGADCYLRGSTTICSCPRNMTGNPRIRCHPPIEDLFCPNEATQHIGQNAKCTTINYEHAEEPPSVSCLEPIKPNTMLQIGCKYNYKVSEKFLPNYQISCKENGEWDGEVSQCEDDCDGNNEFERSTALVWVIGIYDSNGDIENDFPVCVGVLLNAKLVLSHAECLEEYNKSNLIAMAGRFQKNPGYTYRSKLQNSKIENIYVNDNHSIGTGTYGDTRLAIIELKNYFIYTDFVQQACIDWDLLRESSQYFEKFGASADWWKDYYLPQFTSYQRSFAPVEINNFIDYSRCTEPSKNLSEFRNAQQYPQDTLCLTFDLYPKKSFFDSDVSGFGIFAKKKENETNKIRLLAISHYTEKLNLNNSGVRYLKSFIKLLPQKDFIVHYLEEFKYNKLFSKEYLQKPCIIDYRENVFTTSEVTCHLDNEVILCQLQTKPGTIVRSKCKFGYTRSTDGALNEKTCLPGGRWSNELVGCIKNCGQIAPTSTIGLVFGGNITDISNIPWHVGIYANNTPKSNGTYIQICGGTIVHSNIVISAAHCFWDSSYNRQHDKSVYAIAAGKNYRNFDASERQRVQYSNIQKLIIPKTFNELYYRHDIAVLILETPFQYNSYTKPACLTLVKFGNYDIGENVKGLVSGWGARDEFIESSDELRAIEILTMTNENCKNRVRNNRDEITGEKFCAKGKEGETACRGDSGGGFLISQVEEDGIKRFYLWGVVSSGLDITRHCTTDFFTTYTNVQYHQDIINVAISENTLL